MLTMLTRKRMKEILNLIESNSIRTLYQRLEDKKYLAALKVLEARGCVSCFYADGDSLPWHISLTAEAYNYKLTRCEIWENRIYGFIVGIISGVVITIIGQLLLNAMLQLLGLL